MTRTLVVGDVHACTAELDALVELAEPEDVVLVGDLFTKGPDPAGVWARIRDRGWRAVLGNHDVRVLAAVDGERPDDRAAHEAIEALDAFDPSWLPWTRDLPLFLEVAGWTVVHAALHPSGELERTHRYTAINRRRWPDDTPDEPYWWEVYEGERRVVFGHDARRGLVRRERQGEPWLIGLDTGCVYGGSLSGYLIEEDRVLQVPAERQYKAVN